jgi:hypothetical protein
MLGVWSVLYCFEDLYAIIIWERCAIGSDVIAGSDASRMTESDVITGSDVIFLRFFLTMLVVPNVPLHERLEDTKGITRSRKSNDKQHNDQKIPKE